MKSNKDMEEPKRLNPKRDKEEPIRKKLRIASEDPN
jgi:hypothetical protein